MTDATHKSSKGSPLLRRWGHTKIVQLFGADLRSLAAFRIVLGLLVLADLASRATDLNAHYTDRGVLPRAVVMQELLNPWAFSLNLANGGIFFQALLFGVAALAALGLLVGYRTRLTIGVVWVLLISIRWSNPLVNGASAVLLPLLLFWGMFLPLGARWSVDQLLKAAPPRLPTAFLSMATFGLFMQIAFMYWFTAALKPGEEWRVDGTAIYNLLSTAQFATPIGAYLLNFPGLLEVLTFATILFVAFGPFLLFVPFLTGPVRTGTVLAFMSLHFGIWLTMEIGNLPWISAFSMVCFLPGWFWERSAKLRDAVQEHSALARRLQRTVASLISSVVTVGRSSATYLVSKGDDRPSPSQGAGVSKRPTAAWAETLAGREKRRVAAAGPSPATVVAARLRARRLKGGDQRRPPTPRTSLEPTTMLRSSIVTNLFALFFLLYIFFWNLTTVSSFTMPERLVPIGHFLGIGQRWDMFLAPNPSENDGWYVIPGTLRGGQQVDLMGITREDFSLHELSWEKPRYIPSTFKNERWREYLHNIRQEKYADQRLYLGRYICREWNERHGSDEQLETFQITYMREETPPDSHPLSPEGAVLWEHRCF